VEWGNYEAPFLWESRVLASVQSQWDKSYVPKWEYLFKMETGSFSGVEMAKIVPNHVVDFQRSTR